MAIVLCTVAAGAELKFSPLALTRIVGPRMPMPDTTRKLKRSELFVPKIKLPVTGPTLVGLNLTDKNRVWPAGTLKGKTEVHVKEDANERMFLTLQSALPKLVI